MSLVLRCLDDNHTSFLVHYLIQSEREEYSATPLAGANLLVSTETPWRRVVGVVSCYIWDFIAALLVLLVYAPIEQEYGEDIRR